jgi:hypothetical protein
VGDGYTYLTRQVGSADERRAVGQYAEKLGAAYPNAVSVLAPLRYRAASR